MNENLYRRVMRSASQLLLCTTLLLLAVPLSANTWQNALQLQQAGQYTDASTLYESLRSEGYHSPALDYNQAYCAYQAGDYGRSRWCIERALRQKRNWPAARQLRQDILEALDSPETPSPPPPWQAIWQSLAALLPINLWAGVTLLAVWAAGVFAFLGIRRKKRRWGTLAILTLLLAALALSLGITQYRQSVQENRVVVVEEDAILHLSPTADSPVSQALKWGSLYDIQAVLDGWYKLQLADGTIGWVHKEKVERL